MKIRLAGAELFHAELRTDRHDEANSCFSQFLRRRLDTANQNFTIVTHFVDQSTKLHCYDSVAIHIYRVAQKNVYTLYSSISLE